MQQGSSVLVHAPVKINLALHIVGRQADGYHQIESLVVFSPDGDVVEMERADCDSFSIDGPFAASLGNDGDNLVIKARDALRAASGGRVGPVAIRLTKNLPVSSGLGGGSGDAAATLAGLETLMPTRLGAEGLLHCALALGADVPMCLAGIYRQSALLVRGIGEEMEALPDFPALHLVLLNLGMAVSTPDVFAGLEKRQNAPLVLEKSAMLSFDHLTEALQNVRNDLYEPARRIAPELEKTLELLKKSSAEIAHMSGSGATCFGLYRSFAQARKAAQDIAGRCAGCFVLATTTFGKKINE